MVRQDGGTRPPGSGPVGAAPQEETLDGTSNQPQDHTVDGDSTLGRQIVARATAELAVGETLDSDPGGPGGGHAREIPSRVTVNQFPIAHWDRYEFLKLLGQGGMGAVYKARDRRLGRIVALKFIRSGDEQMTNRFMLEARAQSRIDHPGICKVLEVGEVEGKAYIAMQFVDGLSLQQSSHGMTLTDKVQVIKEVAEALHTAHEQQIIHRGLF